MMTKPNPMRRPYPAARASRVDRASMSDEEWASHLRHKGREKCSRWNARNPGKSRAALRKRRHENPWYQSLFGSGDRARKSGLEYDLTAEWAVATYTGYCSLTGFPFVIAAAAPAGKCGLRPYSPSIDRINPLAGYTQDNCRWVLCAINSFKGEISDAEMYHLAAALVSRRPI